MTVPIYPDLPSEVKTGLVTGQFRVKMPDSPDAGQEPEYRAIANADVTVTPRVSQTKVLTEESPFFLGLPPFHLKTNEDGHIYNPADPSLIGVRLIASTGNEAVLSPHGWTYTFTIKSGETNVPDWVVEVPVPADGVVDLIELGDTPPFPGTPTLQQWLQAVQDARAARDAASLHAKRAEDAAALSEQYRDEQQEIAGLTGEDEAVAHLIGDEGSETRAALEAYTPAGAITSPTIGRIIAVAEGQPAPALLDGDVLVRYAIPGDSYYTDFSDATIGATPEGWTSFAVPGGWQVVAEAEAEGGKALSLVGETDQVRRGISWDAPSSDPDRADVEVLLRFKSTWAGYGVLAAGRGTADVDDTGDILFGGVLEDNAVRTIRIIGGVYSAGSLVTQPIAQDSWYLMRYRIEGSTTMVRMWPDGESEPTIWQATGTDGGITAPGLVGIFAMRPYTHRIDWVAVGTGGRQAVKQ